MVEVLFLWTKGNKNRLFRVINISKIKNSIAKLGHVENYLTPQAFKFVKK